MMQTETDSVKQNLEAFFNGIPLEPILHKYLEQYTKYGEVVIEKSRGNGQSWSVANTLLYHMSMLDEFRIKQKMNDPDFDPDTLSDKDRKIFSGIIKSEFADK